VQSAPIPYNENERLAALRSYAVLDRPADRAFQDLVNLLAEICAAPMAALTLVEADRTWSLASSGVESRDGRRAVSICSHAILGSEPLIIADLKDDARFRDYPLVGATPPVRFYAGAPLVDEAGFALGTLCVMDHQPRELTTIQNQTLLTLRDQAMRLLALQRMVTKEGLAETTDYRRSLDSEQRRIAALDRLSAVMADPVLTDEMTAIAGNVTDKIGSAFLEALVANLNRALATDYAVIAELRDGSKPVLRTLAIDTPQGRGEEVSYSLAESACGDVIRIGATQVFPSQVINKFPNSPILRELKAESYAGTPLKDSKCESIGVLAVVGQRPFADVDKTRALLEIFADRAAAELERLQHDAARQIYEQIVSASGDMLAFVDRNCTFRAANRHYAATLGTEPEAIVGKTMPEVFGNAPISDSIEEHAQNCLRGEEQTYASWRDVPGVGPRFIEVHYTPFRGRNEEVEGFVISGRDITARHQAESSLQLSEARFRSAFAHAPIGMALVDAANTFVQVNDSLCGILGYERDELMERRSLDLIDRKHRAIHQQWHAALFAKQASRQHGEERYIHKDGRTVWIDCSATPVVDEHGEVVHLVVQFQDVSARKRDIVEQQLEKEILELIAVGKPLTEVLEVIAHGAEILFPGGIFSILLLNQETQRLYHGAAPSLPQDYVKAIDGLRIGAQVGSYGRAVSSNETVIVTDISTDPLWSEFRQLAGRFDLRACWSLPVPSSDGQPVGAFAVYYRETKEPITAELDFLANISYLAGIAIERHQRQEQLGRYEQIVSTAPDLMSIVSRDYRYLAVSESHKDRYGKETKELVGQSLADLTGRNNFERFQKPLLDRAFAGERVHEQLWTTWTAIGPGWMDVSVHPYYLPDATIGGAVVIARDITALKVTEQALRLSEQRFRGAFNNAPIGMALIEPDRVIGQINREFARMLGYSRPELAERSFDGLTYPHDRQLALQVHRRLFSGTIDRASIEHRWISKDGETLWSHVVMTPVRDGSGTVNYAIAQIEDISEAKRQALWQATESDILARIAKRAPLRQTIEVLSLGAEALFVGGKALVTTLDARSNKLEVLAGPNMPDACIAAFNGLKVGRNSASCGHAAYIDDTVVVADTSTDPLWSDYRQLAYESRIAACWSTPIHASTGRVLGTFALSFSKPSAPRKGELETLGRLARLAGIAMEQSWREEELRRFQHIVSSSRSYLAFVDTEYRFLSVNQQLINAWHATTDSVVGRHVSEFLRAEDWRFLQQFAETALRGEETETTGWIKLSDEVRFFQMFHIPYRTKQGQIVGYVCEARDITELRRAHESRRLYEQIVETASDLTVFTDRDGRYLAVNQAWLDVMGRTREQVIGRTLRDLLGENALEFQQEIRPYFERCINAGESVHYQNDFTIPSRGHRYFDVHLDPFYDDNGDITGVVAAIRDITEAKAYEKQIKELEHRQAESEKIVATGRMAARVAHEINNPLAGIKNAFRLLQCGISADHSYYHYLELIDKELERIARIIREMYELYRPEQEQPVPIDLDELIHDVLVMAAPRQHEKSVDVESRPQHGSQRFVLPADRVRQVLFNLLLNAIHAATPRTNVLVYTETLGNRLRIGVRNQGVPIAKTVRDRIFEPFFTTRRDDGSEKGLGLGLSVCKGIMDSLGGSINFKSDDDGTDFWFELPTDLLGDDIQ
jgi:PAS domain S-box-containing protein